MSAEIQVTVGDAKRLLTDEAFGILESAFGDNLSGELSKLPPPPEFGMVIDEGRRLMLATLVDRVAPFKSHELRYGSIPRSPWAGRPKPKGIFRSDGEA